MLNSKGRISIDMNIWSEIILIITLVLLAGFTNSEIVIKAAIITMALSCLFDIILYLVDLVESTNVKPSED